MPDPQPPEEIALNLDADHLEQTELILKTRPVIEAAIQTARTLIERSGLSKVLGTEPPTIRVYSNSFGAQISVHFACLPDTQHFRSRHSRGILLTHHPRNNTARVTQSFATVLMTPEVFDAALGITLEDEDDRIEISHAVSDVIIQQGAAPNICQMPEPL